YVSSWPNQRGLNFNNEFLSWMTYVSGSNYEYPLVRFDLSALPNNIFVISATLRLFLESLSGPALDDRGRYRAKNFYWDRATSNWSENTVTYDTFPSGSGPTSEWVKLGASVSQSVR